MLFTNMLVIKHQLNHGELVVLLPVFLESEVVVPTGPDRELTVTCVDPDVCSLPPRHGGNGTDE